MAWELRGGEADGRGISPQLPGPERSGLDTTRRSLMLEGVSGEGQRDVGGSETALNTGHQRCGCRGAGGGRPMLALCWAARYFQLFRDGTCGASGGRWWAAGRGQRAGQLCLVRPISEPSGAKPRPLRAQLPLCRRCPELPPVPLVILVRLVPAREQLAGQCSAGVSLAGSDRPPPLVFRGEARGRSR